MIDVDAQYGEIGDLVDLISPFMSELAQHAVDGDQVELMDIEDIIRKVLARWLADLDGAPW